MLVAAEIAVAAAAVGLGVAEEWLESGGGTEWQASGKLRGCCYVEPFTGSRRHHESIRCQSIGMHILRYLGHSLIKSTALPRQRDIINP